MSFGTQSCTAWTGQTRPRDVFLVVSKPSGPVTGSMALTDTPQYEPSAAVSGYIKVPQDHHLHVQGADQRCLRRHPLHGHRNRRRVPTTRSPSASTELVWVLACGRRRELHRGGNLCDRRQPSRNTEYSSAPQVQQSFAVAPASTKTSLSLTSPVTYEAEASAEFTVTVSATRATPTGTVAVNEGTTTLCTITLSSGTGRCSLTAAQLPAGHHTVVAVYSSASTNFSGSSSAAKTLTVKAASTTTALSLTTPVTYGAEASADFTVTVSAAGATPTGTVALREGTTTVCIITLSSGTGECSLTAAQLPAWELRRHRRL